ncbi:hypothetical protein [Actinokineospora terrae]|uniref:Uncharacterized protein n=1 Tax=Actinokineospora terrae TaxID=155974 RepID=A0A1H9KCS2_9PSEU|nr:hypothetical protein [Actinokineospora terrae]SEQ96737.1 hypothetical protein SAMN04487818_101114 [Actinokineospora terrae]
MAITVERAGNALVLREPGADEQAAAIAAALPEERHRTSVVVGASAWPALARLDPWLVADLDDQVDTGVRLLAAHSSTMAAGEVSLARRLADRLGVEVVAPDGDLYTLSGGHTFAAGLGWVAHGAGSDRRPMGHRFPEPWWQGYLPSGHEEIPLGLWVRAGGGPSREDDPLRWIQPDPERPTVVVGAPGEPAPSAADVVEVLDAFPADVRGRVVLACYGTDIAQAVARERGAAVRALHGLPSEHGLVHLDQDGHFAWYPFAIESVYRPGCAPVLDRWTAPLPSLAMFAPARYRLTPGWSLDVLARGLLARPDTLPIDPAIHTPTAPTPDLLLACGPDIPPHVITALTEVLDNLPATTKSTLRILPATPGATLAARSLATHLLGTPRPTPTPWPEDHTLRITLDAWSTPLPSVTAGTSLLTPESLNLPEDHPTPTPTTSTATATPTPPSPRAEAESPPGNTTPNPPTATPPHTTATADPAASGGTPAPSRQADASLPATPLTSPSPAAPTRPAALPTNLAPSAALPPIAASTTAAAPLRSAPPLLTNAPTATHPAAGPLPPAATANPPAPLPAAAPSATSAVLPGAAPSLTAAPAKATPPAAAQLANQAMSAPAHPADPTAPPPDAMPPSAPVDPTTPAAQAIPPVAATAAVPHASPSSTGQSTPMANAMPPAAAQAIPPVTAPQTSGAPTGRSATEQPIPAANANQALPSVQAQPLPTAVQAAGQAPAGAIAALAVQASAPRLPSVAPSSSALPLPAAVTAPPASALPALVSKAHTDPAVPADARSDEAQRRAVRASLGTLYDSATRAVVQLLAERPGLRASGDQATLLTELAVVRVFAEAPGDYDTAFHTCLTAGLRRLPTMRGVVVTGAHQVNHAEGALLRLEGPMLAVSSVGASVPGDTELLIWTTTARRLEGLLDADRRNDVVIPTHTALRVLGVEGNRLLLAEEGASTERALSNLRAAAAARAAVDVPHHPHTARWFGALPAA